MVKGKAGRHPMEKAKPMGEQQAKRKRRPPAHRCTAHSKQTGERCRQPAIPGGNVCRYHGGASPQVQATAKERLAAMVDPALGRLAQLLRTKNERVALGAVKDVLDRNGLQLEDCLTLEDVGRLMAAFVAGVRVEALAIIGDAKRVDALMGAVATQIRLATPALAERNIVDVEPVAAGAVEA
jgi:hypothetical protein